MLTKIRIGLAMSMLALVPVAHADCFKPSPNLVSMGKHYFSLFERDRYTWSAVEEKEKRALSEVIFTDWEGDYSVVECFGTEKNPKEVTRTATVKAKFTDAMNGIVRGQISKQFVAEKRNTIEVLDMFDNRDLFTGKVSKNLIEGTQRRKQKIGPSNSRLLEHVYRIEVNGHKLVLTHETYVNGYLAVTELFNLTRE
ncbi:MAG TPA: hypothetical protein VM553_01035 [Dongiaceae bacterium]|nr:hypothetical protein [Dongiaceae bacterium]